MKFYEKVLKTEKTIKEHQNGILYTIYEEASDIIQSDRVTRMINCSKKQYALYNSPIG